MDLAEATNDAASAGVRHPWELARVEVIKRLLASHVDLPAGAVVVDIGCGDAFVAMQLGAEFPTAVFYAIDSAFTDELVARYRARLNSPNVLLFRTLDALSPAPNRPASLVLLADVIEHVEDDGSFLRDLATRSFVGRDTRFLVIVPAYQWLFSAHDVVLRHYRRYSNRTLKKRLEQSGLAVVDLGYFFLSLVPLRLLRVIKERVFGRKPGVTTDLVTWRGGGAKAEVLKRVLMADAACSLALRRIGITVPGLSNYAICRKSA